MTSSSPKVSKATVLALLQALIAGTEKHFPNGSFTLGNTAYTTAALVQLFKSLIDALTAMNAAQASAKDAVAATRGVEAKVDPVLLLYKRFILTTYVGATQTLADFGLTPPKARAPKTAEQKAAAAAKAKATRVARGTKSKKQKLLVKGDVTGITVTPIISPTPGPAPSAQPVVATPGTPVPAGTATK
ncbi:MAG TPA: hypothetical protein VIF15_22460 [Polyangiaceae bacterium]